MLIVVNVEANERDAQLPTAPARRFRWGQNETVVRAVIRAFLEHFGHTRRPNERAHDPVVACGRFERKKWSKRTFFGQVRVEVLALAHVPRAQELFRKFFGRNGRTEDEKKAEERGRLHFFNQRKERVIGRIVSFVSIEIGDSRADGRPCDSRANDQPAARRPARSFVRFGRPKGQSNRMTSLRSADGRSRGSLIHD